MKFKVVYNQEVFDDLQQAINWYNKQQPGLGDRFFTASKKQLNSLKSSALHYAIRYDNVHCMPIKRFPYMAHYRINLSDKTVTVEAVFNTSRSPKVWKNRSR